MSIECSPVVHNCILWGPRTILLMTVCVVLYKDVHSVWVWGCVGVFGWVCVGVGTRVDTRVDTYSLSAHPSSFKLGEEDKCHTYMY